MWEVSIQHWLCRTCVDLQLDWRSRPIAWIGDSSHRPHFISQSYGKQHLCCQMCNGSNGGTVFKFKEEAAFLAGKDGMEGQCAAMNTSAPLPDTNPANKNAPISAKSVYIAVLLDIGAAWNHWNQKSHSEFFINR
nr:uncharacterized protein LOC112274498 isoform X5 [Physcomitrium patens]|eukprot:XP_024359831.1 uncharacterized protein LOC112274498 isoform X5 [Physcomitrella patens]